VTSQADRQILWYGIWIAYERWVGNGPQILGRCQQTRTKPPGSPVVGPWEEYVGYEICDWLERLAVAIMTLNPRSLGTPLLSGQGNFVSCTVCIFTLNLQWRQPLLHPGGRIWGSTIYGTHDFPRARWNWRVTCGEESPISTLAT
jgi:hypothetical protein